MNEFIISGIVLGIGLFIFLILIVRDKWLQPRRSIDNYKRGRDKLTFRKKQKKKEEVSSGGGLSLGSIIGGFLVILIGTSLLPELSKQVDITQNSINVTGASSTLISIVPIFFIIAIIIIAVTIGFGGLKSSGLI